MKWYGPPIQHQGNFSGDKNHLVFLRIQTGWTECVELMCQLNSSFFVCSIAKSCPTLCYPMDCSMPGFLVLHHLPELAQTHVHWVGDCHPTISSSVIHFSSCLQSFPTSGSFQMSQCPLLHIRWPKYRSFSISSSNEYSGLISFRIDCFNLLAVQGTLKSLLQHHSSKASILWHSFLYSPTLTSIHDYWKNHSFD